ncbi:hypothetical protein BH11BAC1_BH11BAC1_19940 [soil metagenome]
MGRVTKHKRLRIGLIFTGSSDWVGGLYYIHNIIKSLHGLPEEKKPYLLVIPDWKTPEDYISTHGYPFAEIFSLRKHTFVKRVFNKFYKTITSKNIYYDWLTRKYDLQWLYPFHDFRPEMDSINSKKISWIYDFQHKLLPELFAREELERRENEFSLITSKSKRIVVSSYDSMDHLKRFYPNTKASVKVLQFVSVVDRNKITSHAVLRVKYKIDETYFIVSNQFWQHKNHMVILEALKIIKLNGHKINLIFTGKENDHRNSGYFQHLQKFVADNDLSYMIKFLGFISREDQLGLMMHSRAVIQPSKFEGWGTVVEDAKSLLKPVILSDINVHKEQMLDKGYYFAPDNAEELAEIIQRFSDLNFIPVLPEDNHSERLSKFAEDFIQIFDFTEGK